MSKTVILELINIAKCYDFPDVTETHYVLRDVTLQVTAGESVAIVGPSGSGKSTLLNIIGTLDSPTSGRVLLEGEDFSKFNDKELATIRNREIGFVFQLHHLLPQCTVLENVLVPTLVNANRFSKKETETRARRLLERVGLEWRLSHRPGQLSGGERQRVAVVRALINNPKLLLADEPTGSLDRAAADNLAQILVELNREEGVTIILVTHSLNLAERMERVLELRDGILVPQGGRA
ncbi:TPA: ABC transporter ATP-binding protein [Candidatus Poribacteria bacterium]|nr:ABC transporter ATP-binding protein [Candidatus Poribacteria bacterium]